MELNKFEGNPILCPNPENEWESLITCNPGVIHDGEKFIMLYRCAGNDEQHVIRFGLAESTDGFHFERVSNVPVFGPSADGPDSGCVEDPRIVRFGDAYYVTYAYRPLAPGRYWTFPHDVVLKPKSDGFAPVAWSENMGNTGLAMTCDFRRYRRLGRVTESRLDDRDVMFFPEKINGMYYMLHRPKQYVGKQYGVEYPSIWLKRSDDLLSWENKPSQLFLTGRKGTWEEKIGASAPPLLTARGWIMTYHGVEHGGTGNYRVGLLLLDRNDPTRIIGRTPNPVLQPTEAYEKCGMYAGCVFPTGNVILGDTLYVYYGAADKYVGVATASVSQLLGYLLSDECKVRDSFPEK